MKTPLEARCVILTESIDQQTRKNGKKQKINNGKNKKMKREKNKLIFFIVV